jgi:RNA polymerase sigma factor (sigma-70 family)
MNSLTYFRDLAHEHPPLPVAEERALIRAAARRDDSAECARATERLVLHNLTWALEMARDKYSQCPSLLEDAVSVAVGALHAAARSIVDQGKPFRAYAHWIVRRELLEFSRHGLAVAVTRYGMEHRHAANPAGDGGVNQAAASALEPAQSLDERIGGVAAGGPTSLHELVADEALAFRDEIMNREDVRAGLGTLPPRLRLVLEARYGLDGGGQSDYGRIAARLRLGESRVRQLEHEGLRALREFFSAETRTAG